MVAGTSRLVYKPGEKVPESLPPEPGVYDVVLVEYGKKGRAGWAAKPGKFHNRRLVFELLGTEDELTGAPKRVSEFITLSPKALFRVLLLAQAAGYTEELELAQNYDKPGAPASLQNADTIDALLEWIKENGVTMKAQVGVEEYNGRENGRIQRFLPPDEESASTEASAEEGATELADDAVEEAAPEETEEVEEEAPAPAKQKAPAKPVRASAKRR